MLAIGLSTSSDCAREMRGTASIASAVIGRADVVETANQVTITLWVGPRPDADCDGPQKMTQFPFVIDVELREPLGGRTVIDGAR